MAQRIDSTPVEIRLMTLLRTRAEREVEQRGLDWAAEQLDISIAGVKALLWDKRWPLDKTIHIAGRLEVLTDADLDRLAAEDQISA